MALVTPTDVNEKYLGKMRLSTDQIASLEDLIKGIQGELELYIGRLLEPQVVREAIRSDNRGYLNVSFGPVTEIIRIGSASGIRSIKQAYQIWDVNDPAPDYGDMKITNAVTINGGQEMIEGNAVFIGTPNTHAVIEYISGGDSWITPYMPSAKMAITRVAAREFMILHDSSMALNKTAADIDENIRRTPRGWSDYELKRFDRIRRRILL